jgi:hypothetical protein
VSRITDSISGGSRSATDDTLWSGDVDPASGSDTAWALGAEAANGSGASTDESSPRLPELASTQGL